MIQSKGEIVMARESAEKRAAQRAKLRQASGMSEWRKSLLGKQVVALLTQRRDDRPAGARDQFESWVVILDRGSQPGEAREDQT